MDSLTEVLATIDARLAALDAERAELVTARAALARIVGAPVPETSQPAPQAGRRARPTNERDDRILALLQTPQKTPYLAKRLGVRDAVVVYRLNRLMAEGLVTKTGKSRATVYSRT